MSEYCDAKERLKIKAVLLGLQTLSEAKEAEDRNLGDTITRFVQKGWDIIKEDKDTQKDVITYLSQDPDDCV